MSTRSPGAMRTSMLVRTARPSPGRLQTGRWSYLSESADLIPSDFIPSFGVGGEVVGAQNVITLTVITRDGANERLMPEGVFIAPTTLPLNFAPCR